MPEPDTKNSGCGEDRVRGSGESAEAVLPRTRFDEGQDAVARVVHLRLRLWSSGMELHVG